MQIFLFSYICNVTFNMLHLLAMPLAELRKINADKLPLGVYLIYPLMRTVHWYS